MTVTIELTPQTESKLAAQAQARGVSLDHYLQTLIEQLACSPLLLPIEDREKAFEEWADSFEAPAGIREEAFHRENWYR